MGFALHVCGSAISFLVAGGAQVYLTVLSVWHHVLLCYKWFHICFLSLSSKPCAIGLQEFIVQPPKNNKIVENGGNRDGVLHCMFVIMQLVAWFL